MKNKLKKIIINIFSICKIKNVIVFESHADFTDNPKALYDYLIENKFNDKYKIYWFVNDKNKFKQHEIKNVKFVSIWHNTNKHTLIQYIKYVYIVKNAKFLFFGNRTLQKVNKKSLLVCLNHGTPLKKVRDLVVVPDNIDYSVVASDYCIDLISRENHLPKEKLIVLGNPRNDIIFEPKKDFILPEFSKYSKVILWLPTFRQKKDCARVDSNFLYPLGLPVIYNEKDLKRINDYLNKKDMLILLKPHPAQDVSVFKKVKMSNFKIINDDYLNMNNVSLNELFKYTAGLLTDYSGCYFDYLLCDKPIGFTIDDIKEYGKEKGFAFDNVLDIMAGNHINNIDDLLGFLENCYNNKDSYKKKRHEINEMFNKYNDNLSAKRFVEYFDL